MFVSFSSPRVRVLWQVRVDVSHGLARVEVQRWRDGLAAKCFVTVCHVFPAKVGNTFRARCQMDESFFGSLLGPGCSASPRVATRRRANSFIWRSDVIFVWNVFLACNVYRSRWQASACGQHSGSSWRSSVIMRAIISLLPRNCTTSTPAHAHDTSLCVATCPSPLVELLMVVLPRYLST